MNRLIASLLVAAGFIFQFAASVNAASLDDAMNYEAKQKEKDEVRPYTISEMIELLPQYVDDNGHYNGATFLEQDKRVYAFNRDSFGGCSRLNIGFSPYFGARLVKNTLAFSFASDDKEKESASREIKSGISVLDDASDSLGDYGACTSSMREKSVSKMKELLNAIIDAAPKIREEKQRIAALKNEEESRALEEKNRNREKLEQCLNSTEYALYRASNAIVTGQSMIRLANQKIEQENEASKISGYRDARVMHDMGIKITNIKKQNKQYFDEYKRLGGKAKSVEAVPYTDDPCN